MRENGPGYWAVIPAEVRYDDALPANAKLLYGEISSLCDQKGYCYASNAYFSDLYGWSTATVRRLLAALSERGYVQVEVIRDEKTREVQERHIYAGVQAGGTPPLIFEGTSAQKQAEAPLENDFAIKEEQYSNNNTPLPPKGGQGRCRKKQVPRQAPDWKPERFAGLWAYYPKKGRKNKQDAMNAWDDLQPAGELIAAIGQALRALKATEEWQRGVGIPYVATFLRQARWEDAAELETDSDGQPSDSAVERRDLPVWTA